MEDGMFTFSESNELFVLQDEYINKGSTYLLYAHLNILNNRRNDMTEYEESRCIY